MKFRPAWLTLLAIVAAWAPVGSADAASLLLEPTTPTLGIDVGDVIDFDLILDSPEGLQIMGAALLFDPSVVRYEPERSDATDYVLYTGGKGATYLVPQSDPWSVWSGRAPPGRTQLEIVLIEHALLNPRAQVIPAGTGTDLGNVAFTLLTQDTTIVEITFVKTTGTVFDVNGTDLEETVEVNAFEVGWVPEPTTALLVGVGLGGMALFGRGRGRPRRYGM